MLGGRRWAMRKKRVSEVPASLFTDVLEDIRRNRYGADARAMLWRALEDEGPAAPKRGSGFPNHIRRAVLKAVRDGRGISKPCFYGSSGYGTAQTLNDAWQEEAERRIHAGEASWELRESFFDHCSWVHAAGGRKCFANEPYAFEPALRAFGDWVEDRLWPYVVCCVGLTAHHNPMSCLRMLFIPLDEVPDLRRTSHDS
jgi:hypothetical protein